MNHPLSILGATFVLAVGGFWALNRWRRHRELQRLLAQPFPAEWQAILQHRIPLYDRLNETYKAKLHRAVRRFLHEKNFEGCGGLSITDDIRLTIAGQACLLLLGHKGAVYPKLVSILVYPTAFVQPDGLFLEGDSEGVHLGESWQHGTVILAWDSVRRGAANFSDGMNVAIHEFAHQLDQEDGAADGAPLLEHQAAYATWSKVFQQEYTTLQRRLRKNRWTLLDPYGATAPAEFFAVASETFFEKPKQMQRHHPELYQELSGYYRLDPASWLSSKEGNP